MRTTKSADGKIRTQFEAFKTQFQPLPPEPPILTDGRTGAKYCECSTKAKKLVALSTIDVPINAADPTAPRANREIVDSEAFARMCDDANKGRSFSNIVTEYVKGSGKTPLKIIGGQHRYKAIEGALTKGQDNHHGIKVYFALNTAQRLDVQLISNINIANSKDLIDRMLEDARGPELRTWCRSVGLLRPSENFTDLKKRGGAISVRLAKTFITNFYLGQTTDEKSFDAVDTTPILSKTGKNDPSWDELLSQRKTLWNDPALRKAAEQFADLIRSQRAMTFSDGAKRESDWPEKALNPAILSGWAYMAGLLQKNPNRLSRHFALARRTSNDPLNAEELSAGRHPSDGPKYRGFGNRQDPRECGRAVELFYKQSEKGHGITKALVDIAISKHVLKRNRLEVEAKEARENNHA